MGNGIKMVCQEAGAHPWILERRNGLARGIYSRLKAGRFPSRQQILTQAPRNLDTMVSASGYSAYEPVIGVNPMDLYGWGDTDEDLLFDQDSSTSG